MPSRPHVNVVPPSLQASSVVTITPGALHVHLLHPSAQVKVAPTCCTLPWYSHPSPVVFPAPRHLPVYGLTTPLAHSHDPSGLHLPRNVETVGSSLHI